VARLRVPISAERGDHIRGPARAAITLVEYGDYQCPWCGQAFYILACLEARYRNDLRFAFRHFPLTQVHPCAMIAAEGAEAAGAQDQFWDMHELLYQNQPSLTPEDLVEYATELGISVEFFLDDLESHRHRDHVHDDFMSGVRSGVNGTPCLFINNERWNGPVDEAVLARAFDGLLAGRQESAHP
jgi:protein-disulfide isomerase